MSPGQVTGETQRALEQELSLLDRQISDLQETRRDTAFRLSLKEKERARIALHLDYLHQLAQAEEAAS